MQDLEFIRSHIQKILLEREEEAYKGETTTGAGKGSWKGEIKAAENLAIQNPKELLTRLKISGVTGTDDINKLNDLLERATTGADAMKAVFQQPVGRKNKESGKVGVRIPVKIIPPRDGMKYIELTILAAKKAGIVNFVEDVQVEILGVDILAYFAKKPRTWGKEDKK